MKPAPVKYNSKNNKITLKNSNQILNHIKKDEILIQMRKLIKEFNDLESPSKRKIGEVKVLTHEMMLERKIENRFETQKEHRQNLISEKREKNIKNENNKTNDINNINNINKIDKEVKEVKEEEKGDYNEFDEEIDEFDDEIDDFEESKDSKSSILGKTFFDNSKNSKLNSNKEKNPKPILPEVISTSSQLSIQNNFTNSTNQFLDDQYKSHEAILKPELQNTNTISNTRTKILTPSIEQIKIKDDISNYFEKFTNKAANAKYPRLAVCDAYEEAIIKSLEFANKQTNIENKIWIFKQICDNYYSNDMMDESLGGPEFVIGDFATHVEEVLNDKRLKEVNIDLIKEFYNSLVSKHETWKSDCYDSCEKVIEKFKQIYNFK